MNHTGYSVQEISKYRSWVASSDITNTWSWSTIYLTVTELKQAATHKQLYLCFSCTLFKECKTGNIKHVLGLTNFWSYLKQFHGVRKTNTNRWSVYSKDTTISYKLLGFLVTYSGSEPKAWYWDCGFTSQSRHVFLLVHAVLCLSTGFVMGQCPIQCVLPNIYKQGLASEFWCLQTVLPNTNNHLPIWHNGISQNN